MPTKKTDPNEILIVTFVYEQPDGRWLPIQFNFKNTVDPFQAFLYLWNNYKERFQNNQWRFLGANLVILNEVHEVTIS